MAAAGSALYSYPKARRDPNPDNDHVAGATRVSNPYAWLEDPVSKETKQFVLE